MFGCEAGDAVTPPENRRRSARLSSKGRVSGEGIEVVAEIKRPAVKRSRKSRENGKDEKDGGWRLGLVSLECDQVCVCDDGGWR